MEMQSNRGCRGVTKNEGLKQFEFDNGMATCRAEIAQKRNYISKGQANA